MNGENTPTIASQIEGSSGNQLIDFTGRAQLAQLIMEGQRLQKSISDPGLQPTFIEKLLAMKGFDLGITQKAEQRHQLRAQQTQLAQYLLKNDHPELLQAVYGKLSPEQAPALIKAMMDKPRAQVGQAMQDELGASVTQGTPQLLQQIAHALQAENPEGGTINPLSEQRPPTMQEQAARAGPLLQKFLPLLALTQGKSGDIFKAIEETRKQEDRTAFESMLVNQAPGSPSPSASVPQSITSTPLPLSPSQGPSQNNKGIKPLSPIQRAIVNEAQRQGVDPALALALVGRESGFDPSAKGDKGNSHGLFQLQPAAAAEMGINPATRMLPINNIPAGIRYLKKQLDANNGNVEAGLTRYNGGGDPHYARKVMQDYPAYVAQLKSNSVQGQTNTDTSPPLQAPSPSQPYTLPPYRPGSISLNSITLSPSGLSRTAGPPPPEENAAAYVGQAIQQGGWRQLGPALANTQALGHRPRAEAMTQLMQQASQMAYQEARTRLMQAQPQLTDPHLHTIATQEAFAKTNGFFTGQNLPTDPVALHAAQTRAGIRTTQQEALTSLANQVADKTAIRAGEQAGQVTAEQGLAEQRLGADIPQPVPGAPVPGTPAVQVSPAVTKQLQDLQDRRDALRARMQGNISTTEVRELALQIDALDKHMHDLSGTNVPPTLRAQAVAIKTQDDLTKLRAQHTQQIDLALQDPIVDASRLLHYPGAPSGITGADLIKQRFVPQSPKNIQDAQDARLALNALAAMKRTFTDTQPPENFVGIQRAGRGLIHFLTQTEKANEVFETARFANFQIIANVGGADKRFSEMEIKNMDKTLPHLGTRASSAAQAWILLEQMIKAKLGDPSLRSGPSPTASGTQAPLPSSERERIKEEIRARSQRRSP